MGVRVVLEFSKQPCGDERAVEVVSQAFVRVARVRIGRPTEAVHLVCDEIPIPHDQGEHFVFRCNVADKNVFFFFELDKITLSIHPRMNEPYAV